MNTNHSKRSEGLSSFHPTRRRMLAGTSIIAAATAASVGSIHSPAVNAQSSRQATPSAGAEADDLRMVYGFEAHFTDMVIVGLTPRGVRLDAPYEGHVVAGPFEGSTVRGTDYLLFRADGLGVIDARGVVATPEGDAVSYQSTGYVHMPEGVELPLEMLLDPAFAWPDMDFILHGFSLNETGAADMVWLNRIAFAFRGTANPGTGALSATFFAFTPVAEMPVG
jgi:hypothetical protein